MDDACWDHDKLGKRSSATVVTTRNAQDLTVIAQIDISAEAGITFATIYRRVKRNPITFRQGGHVFAGSCDSSRRFVSHHDRRNAASRGAIVAVDIAAADSASCNANQNLISSGLRNSEIG